MRGEDGIFLGVMTRRINPANYEKFFASVALGTGAAISMFHADGTMLARYPQVDELIGQNFAKAPLLQRVRERGTQQTLRVQSPVDQTDRLGSAAPLGHYSGIVVATNTVTAALADWREQTRFLVIAATLAAAVIALILFLIIRQITRQNREAQQRLEAERGRLDTALNNMIQGLVTFDASARLVTFNRRYIEMYDLSTDIVKPGCHFRDLMQHRKDSGSFDGDVDAFCSLVMRNVARGQVDPQRHAVPGRTRLPGRQQAAGGRRLGRHHGRHHRAAQSRAGARPQLRLPEPDHRSHPVADHREGRARPALSAGQPRGGSPVRHFARPDHRQDGL